MDDYLRITSRGEIDKAGFTLMGASVKKTDEPIGAFGSGLKYSITALLRLGIKFRVFSGVNEILFTTEKRLFRDKEFDVVVIDGETTSLTTEMGEGVSNDWNDAFPIFREIYSNAIDEGDARMLVTSNVIGLANYTSFYIQYTGNFVDMFVKFNEYFSFETKPLVDFKVNDYPAFNIKILPKGVNNTARIFRKGILAFSDNGTTKSLYNYDLDAVKINESRVITNIHKVKSRIGVAWASCPDISLFIDYVNGLKGGNAGTFEHDCMPSKWDTPSIHIDVKNWLLKQKFIAVEHLILLNEPVDSSWTIMPLEWIKYYLKYLPELIVYGINSRGVFFTEKAPSTQLFDKVQEALDILKRTSYKDSVKDVVIKYVRFDENSTKALAEEGAVYLSITLQHESVDHIAKIIIEEIEHLATGYEDSTRAFQNHWIKLFYNQLILNTKIYESQ